MKNGFEYRRAKRKRPGKRTVHLFCLALLFLFPFVLPCSSMAAEARDSILFSIPVEQEIHRRDHADHPLFFYTLMAKEGAPLPEGKRDKYNFSIGDEERKIIGPISFSKPGSYQYVLRCNSYESDRFSYQVDSKVYNIEIHVLPTYTGEWKAVLILKGEDGYKVKGLSFIHERLEDKPGGQSKPEHPESTPEKTPPMGDPFPYQTALLLALSVGCFMLLLSYKRKSKRDEVEP
ncbi:MAG: hypothetical protein PT957_03315 [Firmicutes bacterium]|nr:hypothetical protein [Bacillota bacterium]